MKEGVRARREGVGPREKKKKRGGGFMERGRKFLVKGVRKQLSQGGEKPSP